MVPSSVLMRFKHKLPRVVARRGLPRPLAWLLILNLALTPFAAVFAVPATSAHAQATAQTATQNATQVTAPAPTEEGEVGSITLDVPPSDTAPGDTAPGDNVSVAQTTNDEEIVYLDAGGTVRIIDPFVPTGRVNLGGWFSPVGGWQNFANGDVNGDGDQEIIVVNEVSGLISLTVYDPVLASGGTSDQGGNIAGVPWDVLYETTFTGAAPSITSGNFDRAISADEIFIGFRSFSGGYRAIILNAASLNPTTQRPTGRDWKIHVDQILDVPFKQAESGDVVGNGIDEIVLVEADDLPDAAFRVYEAENNFRFIDRFGRSNSSMFHIAVGNVVPNLGGEEVVAMTDTASRNNLFVASRLGTGQISPEDNQYQFVPSPLFAFLADLTGNGDKELFFLRDYDGTDRARLIMRNEWGDDVEDTADFEVRLDDDSGYKSGAGGDSNGNGREEIAIMRNDRIRLYTEPVRGPDNFIDYNQNTNTRSIRFANLDAVGFSSGPQLQISPDALQATIEFGALANIGQIDIANVSTNDVVQVSAQALNPDQSVAGFISFVPVTAPTPASIVVRFNASGLNPGVYTGNIRITSPQQNIVNLPAEIPFTVTILEPPPPGFNPSTGGTGFFYYPCSDYFAMLDEEPAPAGTQDAAEAQTTATLNEPTMPQTVTVRFNDTPGATGGGGTVTMAVIDAPNGAGSAQTGSAGPTQTPEIVDAFVDGAGNVVLIDAQGGRTLIEMPQGQEVQGAASAQDDDPMWPSLVPWVVSVTSNRDQIPLTVEIVGDLYPVIRDLEPEPDYIRRAAMLVVVGDQIYGPPPRNVRVVPLTMVCANGFLGVPSMLNQR